VDRQGINSVPYPVKDHHGKGSVAMLPFFLDPSGIYFVENDVSLLRLVNSAVRFLTMFD